MIFFSRKNYSNLEKIIYMIRFRETHLDLKGIDQMSIAGFHSQFFSWL